jgi:hypothetical protein
MVLHAAFMWIVLHRTAMRVVPFAGILMLLHRFFMFTFFLGALFRGQQRVHIFACLNGRHPQTNLQLPALFQLGFDRSEVCLFILG